MVLSFSPDSLAFSRQIHILAKTALKMEAIEFVHKYESYLDDIQLIVKPELYPIINELRETDPHDLVTPETWFPRENDAKGYVWALLMQEVRKHGR
jgi:hypothetical protein